MKAGFNNITIPDALYDKIVQQGFKEGIVKKVGNKKYSRVSTYAQILLEDGLKKRGR